MLDVGLWRILDCANSCLAPWTQVEAHADVYSIACLFSPYSVIPEQLEEAELHFQGTGVMITTRGQMHLSRN